MVNLNYNLPQNDKLYFGNGFFDLKNKSFIAKDIEIKLKKDTFGNLDNDPRLKGVSAEGKNEITKIKKGILQVVKIMMIVHHGLLLRKEIKHDKEKNN